jgi:hypothetical protein
MRFALADVEADAVHSHHAGESFADSAQRQPNLKALLINLLRQTATLLVQTSNAEPMNLQPSSLWISAFMMSED